MGGEDSRAFGSTLRRLRLAAGLTQQALAEKAGISVDAVAALESGRRHSPRAYTFRRLTDALHARDAERALLAQAAIPAPRPSVADAARYRLGIDAGGVLSSAAALSLVPVSAELGGRLLVTPVRARPVLYVIACDGPPAGELPAFVRFGKAEGWDVCVIATQHGTKFMDFPRLAELTRHQVRVNYEDPDAPDVLPPADAFVIAPATFDLVNKLAQGISDTLALSLVNEAVGLSLPIVAVPWPNAALARHPVFRRNVGALREWGITVILDTARLPDASQQPAVFPWDDLRSELARLRASVQRRRGAP